MQNRFSSGGSSRSSYGQRPRGGQSRSGRSFGGGRPGGQRGGYRHKSFDPSMFVKKAEILEPEVFTAVHTFADFALERQLQYNIERRGYTAPTPIQDQVIPLLIEGRDIIGLANTGTGKTAAFLIPLINKVVKDPSQRVLIVAPTRELAVQIDQEFKQFAQNMGIYSAICIGGVNIRGQMFKLQRRPHFVIGTPGRLRDLESQRALNFKYFNNIVLDEVDRMMDMGFINEVRYITSLLPDVRQSLFFSATLTDSLQPLVNEFLDNPVRISVKSREASANIDQDIVRLQGKLKVDVLHDLLIQQEFEKVLVFLRTKHATEKLVRTLEDRGFKVSAIHGNKNQNQRQKAIDLFKKSVIQVLVATDVAARGLDIANVTHVINYDLPESYEDYIHRIGRTGRADKKGVALTFID